VAMITRLFDSLKQLLEFEGRELRDQVYRVTLSLIVICVAIILMLAGLVTGGIAAYCGLRHVMGPAEAMGIITLTIFIVAVLLGVAGYRLYPGHESHQKAAARRLEREQEAARQNATEAMAAAAAGQPNLLMNALPSHPEPAGYPPTISGSDAIETALEKPLKLVRTHPLATIGLAFGLGILASRSGVGRHALKAGLVWGAKQCVDRYLFPQR